MELSGSTDVLSLFDLVQILSLNEATGRLEVENEVERGYLFFDTGQIINAIDADRNEGEAAAKRVFSVLNATFSFSSREPGVSRLISCPAQSLMMDIARKIDEERSEPDASEVDPPEPRSATAELDDLFSRLDSESQILHRFHNEFGILDCLGVIRKNAGATMFLTPGARPEVRVGRNMRPVSEAPLDHATYRALRDDFLRDAHRVASSIEGDPEEFVLEIEEERFAADLVPEGTSETLLVRRLPTPGEIADAIPWPPEILQSLLAEPGSVLLVVGSESVSIEVAFESSCQHLIASGWRPFVGLANRWTPGLGDGCAGTVLLSRRRTAEILRAGSIVSRLDPAVVAVDDSDCPVSLLEGLRAWRRGARGVLGVCARSASQAPRRLLDALEVRERRWLAQQLGMGLTGVLWADSTPGSAGKVWLVDDVTRVALLDGDPSPLTRELAGKELAELEG